MDSKRITRASVHGVISLVVSVIVTYGVHTVYPSQDIAWALTAVAIASIFSGTFSAYYANE